MFDKINEQLTHTRTFGGTFEGNNYAGNHKYIRVNKISLFIKFNKPAHDILFPCMAVIVCMNSYCPSPRMHIHISSTTHSIIYPYVETKDEETMTTNDQSGHSRRAVKKCLANLLPSYEVRSLVAELINRTFSLLLTFGRQ